MELDNEMHALLLLSSLPDSWETLVVSFSNSVPKGKLTMSMVTDALFSEEARKKDMGGDQSHALVTENKGRGRDRERSKSRGRRQREIQRRYEPTKVQVLPLWLGGSHKEILLCLEGKTKTRQ